MIHQRRVLNRLHPVTDPLHPQIAHRLPNGGRAAPFARMCGQAQACLPRQIERIGVIALMAHILCPAHAEPGDKIVHGFRRTKRVWLGGFRPFMTDTGDHAAHDDAAVAFGLIRRLFDRGEVFAPRAQIAAAAEIRAQKRLRVDHPLGGGLLQNRFGQAAEFFRPGQHRGRRLIGAQELLESIEPVGAVFVEHAVQIDALFLRQTSDKSGRGRTLQMQMQLNQRCHRKLLPGPRSASPK